VIRTLLWPIDCSYSVVGCAKCFMLGAPACWLNPTACAAVVWDESIHGDLSGDRFNPTHITLAAGINSIIATTNAGDLEYFTINLPQGWQLNALTLPSYVGEDRMAFIAVQAGPIFTEPNIDPNVANLLGWSHFGPLAANVGTDILDNIGQGQGAQGFEPPLPSGQYTFWVQQIGPQLVTYQFNFIVVPAPSALVVFSLFGCAIKSPRRSRRHARSHE
jgi:hypothetical protein